MKKTLKIISFIFLSFAILSTALILILNSTTFNVKLDENKLVNSNRTIVFYDNNDKVFAEQSKGLNITTIDSIPSHTINAFIAIEDKRFYNHNGVDYKALLRATFNNLKSGSIKEGASTITQQLIKNTHLSNEKTLKRKITEIKLAKQLEKKFSKNQILETYLNTIYFGDNCYGITSAAMHYFNKTPKELDINESATLAAIVKAPTYYSPFNDLDKSIKRKNLVLSEMLKQNYITKNEFEENINKPLNLSNSATNEYDFLYLTNNEISPYISKNPYKFGSLNIHTTLDTDLQSLLKDILNDYTTNKHEMSVIIMDKNASILAYFSTYGDNKRQIGSIIKPIGVYAPAIEENIVNSCTILCDKKEDFNGYSPSNYNDVYRNNISVKDSLCYSSNICAVKLLNSLGVKKSTDYLNKLGINLSNNDQNLALALGATEKGTKLSDITAAYCAFINKGYFSNPKCTKNIIKQTNKRVFGEDTAYIVSDMLNGAVKYGTAKKLSFTNDNLYAKTGTVGNKNGNTDAYTISFSKNYVLGVWCGAKDGELIPNSISGGTLPAKISADIWNKIEKEKGKQNSIDMPNSVSELNIDKTIYEQDNKIILSDDNAPSRYKLKYLFKNDNLPKEQSSRFTKPKIKSYETSVIDNAIKLELCVTELCGARLYKIISGKKELIFDTKDGNIYIDKKLKPNDINQYIIIPYYQTDNNIFYGKEVVLEKIKTPNLEFGDNWWDYD
ncbi:MAG: hypothetical protein E7340_03260 [Clostridiales bacterium]|nr:hypothetical protein [Clostridiales bacterium]